MKSRTSPAPSSRAASISSFGIWAKKFRIRKTANGRPNATWKRTTPAVVSKRPTQPNSSDTGTSATCTGTASSATTRTNHQSRPGNSSHAKAYPASEPITMTSTVAGTVIATVESSEPVIAPSSSTPR